MTDLAGIVRKPNRVASLVRRFLDWMSEEVYAQAPMQCNLRDWADLPVHHPIRDDRGGRSGSSWRGRVAPPA